MRTLTTILTALALMIAPLGTTLASASPDEVETNVEPDRAEMILTNTTNETTATVTVTLDTAQGILATNLTADDQARTLDVNVTLHQLVEYRAHEDEDAFTDNATTVSAWNIAEGSQNATAEANGTLEWAPIEEENITADDGETEGILITGQAIFPGEQPDLPVEDPTGQQLPTLEERNVTIKLAAFGQHATYNGQDIGPLQAIVAFEVNGFPYEAEDTDLALVMEDNAAVQTVDLDGAAIKTTDSADGLAVDLALDWNEEATVDEQGASIVATQPSAHEDAEADQLVALSYDRGENIKHNGLIGASLADSQDDEGRMFDTDDVPAPSLLAALASIATVALVANRIR